MNEESLFPTIERVAELFEPYSEVDHCPVKLIGVRGIENEDNYLGVYDDAIFRVIHKDITRWEASTDPGRYWLQNPLNPKGCAKLREGLWWYEFGQHRGHAALIQSTVFEVERLSPDGKINCLDKGRFGINLHSGGPGDEAEDIGRWSAGCQIIKTPTPWDEKWLDFFIPLRDACEEVNQTYIPYLLITKKQLTGEIA